VKISLENLSKVKSGLFPSISIKITMFEEIKFASIITSLIDYPSHVSSVIFLIGCNLRCQFCQNSSLWIENNPLSISSEYILEELEKRKSFSRFIVVSGGEPCIYPSLPDFIKYLYNSGFKVKLDTNGLNPDMIKRCIPYLDYIAMDIKTSPELYVLLEPKVKWKLRQFYELDKIQKSKYYRNKILKSIKLIMNSGINYEFRTTVVPGLVTEKDIRKIGKLVKGCKKYVLQQFIPSKSFKKELRKIIPYSERDINKFAKILENFNIKEVKILL